MSETCVVIGAGPVGLVAALALRKQGLPVVVIEAEFQDRVRPGSRAIFLGYPTTRRLDQLRPGVGAAVRDAGIAVQGYDTLYSGRRVFHQSFTGPIKHMGTSLPQKVTERILYQAAIDCGVQFRWHSPVAGLTTTTNEVTIELADGETFTAPYVIGADGARSVVRKAIGATMEGSTDDTPFIIVDVAEHPDGSTPKSWGYFHYDAPELGGRNVMHMPFASGMRIDLQCLRTDDAEYMASPKGIREWMSTVVDPWYADHVEWVSTYRFHQVVADSYTDTNRRVLLAGEAAHLFAPFGGRGLNSGVIDASDAATAIGKAIASNDSRAIEQCAKNRREWGLRNRGVSSQALKVMRGTDRVTKLQRQIAARIAPAFPPAGAWLANGPVQLPTPRLGTTDLY